MAICQNDDKISVVVCHSLAFIMTLRWWPAGRVWMVFKIDCWRSTSLSADDQTARPQNRTTEKPVTTKGVYILSSNGAMSDPEKDMLLFSQDLMVNLTFHRAKTNTSQFWSKINYLLRKRMFLSSMHGQIWMPAKLVQILCFSLTRLGNQRSSHYWYTYLLNPARPVVENSWTRMMISMRELEKLNDDTGWSFQKGTKGGIGLLSQLNSHTLQ